MEIVFSKNNIKFNKKINNLDIFVIEFTKILRKHNIKYVIISGYVSILFGRSRNTEDVDIFIEKINYDKFLILWNELSKKFCCLATSNPKIAYDEYLNDKTAIRFSYIDSFIPNFELSFPKDVLDKYSLDNAIHVNLEDEELYISPLELQIAYKLFLGSEKDLEDARFLFKLFKEHLNKSKLTEFVRQLKVNDKLKYLGE